MQLTPTIYATGRYQVRDPFTLVDGVDYTCHAVRTFKECQQRGMDVFKEVYEANGIGRDKYLTDEAAGINIIALMTEGQPTLYIPDSYIASYPNLGEAVPQRLIISVDIGVISSHWSPDYLIEQMRNLASDIAGGEPEVELHSIPLLGRKSSGDVPAIEAGREVAVTQRTSDYAKTQELERSNALLREKVRSLENKVLKP
tara:strand:+ start:197072 stop:197671 length:600 start_codon:yes stop_codon:yes gene_type:complete